MPPTEGERPVEALGPDRLDHALGVGIGVRGPDRGADDPHPFRAEHRVEQAAELRVPVSDDEPDEPNSHVRIVGFVSPKLTRPPLDLVGIGNPDSRSDHHRYHRPMWSLLYLVARALVRLLVGGGQQGQDDGSKDLEILVLRHQLRVLQRTAGRPRLRPIDRVLFAAASRVIPRERWVAFLVTPGTLLRWHRELVRRKWTYRRSGRPGRPPIAPAVRALILRLARENPRSGRVRIEGQLRTLGVR